MINVVHNKSMLGPVVASQDEKTHNIAGTQRLY